jgi:cytochrome c biogenesis protein CcdA/thiol-disulfide isomerase/thioredoxin
LILLILFALLAGAGTALSPCVLPVLPAVLSAGVTGGRRRPLGVATGLALSFTFATVGLVYLIDALGLPDDFARKLAIVVLFGFGLMLLLPPLSDRVEAFASRFTGGPKGAGREGFGGGLLLGASLGFVYFPCAGPILSAVIVVSSSQAFTLDKLIVAFAYSIGSAGVIYAILLLGRRLTDRLGPIKGRVNQAMGLVMIAVALLLVTNTDISFENWLARNAPGFVFNPTKAIETSGAVAGDLSSIRGGHGIGSRPGIAEASAGRTGPRSTLPVLGPAADFTNTQRWFNTPGGRPLSIHGLRGKVVLVDFWTYTCINCIRTLPYVEAWYRRYHRDGLEVVGVHTPEFPFEKEAGNVQQAIKTDGISYPVVQDNDYGTWSAYGNQYWPADYLIDAQGRVRDVHFGEGDYGKTEQAIRSLLAERGRARLGHDVRVRAQAPSRTVTTPESYLGGAKAQTVLDRLLPGVHSYTLPPSGSPPPDRIALGGSWRLEADSATAVSGAGLQLNFGARRVFLVLGSAGGRPRSLQVRLDGQPISSADAGSDVHGGTVTVSRQRLYNLVDLPKVERHTLSLSFAPGISGYAFTFG